MSYTIADLSIRPVISTEPSKLSELSSTNDTPPPRYALNTSPPQNQPPLTPPAPKDQAPDKVAARMALKSGEVIVITEKELEISEAGLPPAAVLNLKYKRMIDLLNFHLELYEAKRRYKIKEIKSAKEAIDLVRRLEKDGQLRASLQSHIAKIEIGDLSLQVVHYIVQLASLPKDKLTPPVIDELLKGIISLKSKDKINLLLIFFFEFSKTGNLPNQKKEALLNTVLALDSKNLIARRELARFYLSNGKINEGIAQYKILTQDHPRDFTARLELANLYAATGGIKEAVGEFSKAVESAKAPQELSAVLMNMLALNGGLYQQLGYKQWEKDHPVLNIIASLWNGIKLLISPLNMLGRLIFGLYKIIKGIKTKEADSKEMQSAASKLWELIGKTMSKVNGQPHIQNILGNKMLAFCDEMMRRVSEMDKKGEKKEVIDYLMGYLSAVQQKGLAIIEGAFQSIEKNLINQSGLYKNFKEAFFTAGSLFDYFTMLHIYIKEKAGKLNPAQIKNLNERAEKIFELMKKTGEKAFALASREKNFEAMVALYNVLKNRMPQILVKLNPGSKELVYVNKSCEKVKERLIEIGREQNKIPKPFQTAKGKRIKSIKIISGRTRKDVILRELKLAGINLNDKFDGEKLEQALVALQKRLPNTFMDYDLKVKESWKEVDLIIHFKEMGNKRAGLEGYYGSTQNYGFKAEFQIDNLRGRGETLKLDANFKKIGEDYKFGGGALYFFPYLFNLGEKHPVSAAFSARKDSLPYFEKEDPANILSRDYIGGKVNLEATLTRNWRAGVGTQAGWNTVSRQDSIKINEYNVYKSKTEQSFFDLQIMPHLTYDTRNRFIAPTAGSILKISAGGGLYDQNGFLKTEVEARKYFPLFWGNSLALRASIGYGYNLSAGNQFYLGGVNQYLRGCSNPLGAGAGFNAYNAEFRTPLVKVSSAFMFQFYAYADFGFTFDNFRSRSPLGFGVGIGVRVWVMGLPLNIYYGIPLGISGGFGFEIGGWN